MADDMTDDTLCIKDDSTTSTNEIEKETVTQWQKDVHPHTTAVFLEPKWNQ
jgi:hypothetical protein